MFRNFVESSRVRLLSGRWPPWDWWPALLATRGGRNTATAPQPTTTTSQSLPQSSTHILNLPTPASSWITCLRTHISLHAPCSTGRAGPCCSAGCTSLGHPLTSSGVTQHQHSQGQAPHTATRHWSTLITSRGPALSRRLGGRPLPPSLPATTVYPAQGYYWDLQTWRMQHVKFVIYLLSLGWKLQSPPAHFCRCLSGDPA